MKRVLPDITHGSAKIGFIDTVGSEYQGMHRVLTKEGL